MATRSWRRWSRRSDHRGTASLKRDPRERAAPPRTTVNKSLVGHDQNTCDRSADRFDERRLIRAKRLRPLALQRLGRARRRPRLRPRAPRSLASQSWPPSMPPWKTSSQGRESGFVVDGLSDPVVNRDLLALGVVTVMLVILALLNAIFTTWATVLEARRAAVMRALGASARQVAPWTDHRPGGLNCSGDARRFRNCMSGTVPCEHGISAGPTTGYRVDRDRRDGRG